MSDAADGLTIQGLGAYWRDALDAASAHVDRQIAGTAMLLSEAQYLKASMGPEKAAEFLEILSRMVRDGEMASVTIGDVTLHLRDEGQARQ